MSYHARRKGLAAILPKTPRTLARASEEVSQNPLADVGPGRQEDCGQEDIEPSGGHSSLVKPLGEEGAETLRGRERWENEWK